MIVKKYIFRIQIALIVILALTSDLISSPDSLSNPISLHLALGMPIDNNPQDDYIIVRQQYVVSYNPIYNAVNWVGWNLNSSWIGKSGRYSGNFITDTTLPEEILQISHKDYTNSGYDRGHLVRSHERSSSTEDNKMTFLMTNIVPQTPDLNRGVWLNFERFCEELAIKQNKELYIYSGGIYLSDSTIGRGVRVPDSCYKIVVVLENGEGLDCVNYNTKIYSVKMPNIQGIRNHKWSTYAVSVNDIERSTGYDFLKDVPIEIQGIIELIVARD